MRANYTQTIHEAYIERLRVKETKRQRVGESTVNGQWSTVKETKRQRDEETKRQRVKETKRQGLPQPLPKGKGFVAALMHLHVFWGGLRDKESKSQRVKETKRLRD